MLRPLIPVLMGLLVGSCGILSPDGAPRIGDLPTWYEPLVVPDSVMAGRSFLVYVTTEGGGCTQASKTVVEIHGNVATITPYDYSERGNLWSRVVCLANWVLIHREVELLFPSVGPGRVILRAQSPSDPDDVQYTFNPAGPGLAAVTRTTEVVDPHVFLRRWPWGNTPPDSTTN